VYNYLLVTGIQVYIIQINIKNYNWAYYIGEYISRYNIILLKYNINGEQVDNYDEYKNGESYCIILVESTTLYLK
jgi:hypothetical protein